MPGKVFFGGGGGGLERGDRDGVIVDADQATVPVFDRGFLYGDSVYEVMRTFGGRPYALDEHLERLAGSAARIGMALPSLEVIAQTTRDTISATGELECYVRIVVTRGSGTLGLDPALSDRPRLVVMALPLHLPDESCFRDGVAVAIVGARRNAPGAIDPLVKSGNYLNSVMAVAEARRKGAYEALMCDAVGRLAEGSSSNLFLVRRAAPRRLCTPPLSVGLLEGITRRHVIRLGALVGYAVDEVGLWPVDLQQAAEAFITSSVRGVVPVVQVDGQPIGDGRPGALTQEIMRAYLGEAARSVK